MKSSKSSTMLTPRQAAVALVKATDVMIGRPQNNAGCPTFGTVFSCLSGSLADEFGPLG